jgi:hypothetical protein
MTMLSDADKAAQRAFERKIAELENMLHDMGGTKRGMKDMASQELKFARNKLVEASHWVRDHYYRNIIQPNRPPRPTQNGTRHAIDAEGNK